MSYGYPAPPPGPYGPPPPPPNHMVMAILTTVACCLPFGIVSLVYANKVNTLWQTGRYAEAAEASNNAKTWWIVSIVATAAVAIVWLGVLISFGGRVANPY
jgi:uncharacterized membrane-anchored protein